VLDAIHFAGRKGRHLLKYYYSAADIFVTTPWYEPFGITPLEAMACGTPVIGANVGGIKYSVVDGETGALVSPESPDELANKVSELLSNQNELRRLGQNAIRRVNQHFTWKSVADKVNMLYEEILQRKLMKAG
jgi:glycosyltransferase involved in cell wall biosynthesis